jgi:hypothetical protein
VHNLFLVYLFLLYLSISTCFGRLCAHHQEKQLCLCDTCCLLFCMDGCLVCWVHTRQPSIQENKYQVSHKHSCFSWCWAHSRPKHVETDKYTGCPTCYRTRHFFDNFSTNEDIAAKSKTDLPHCVRNVTTTNVLLSKFRCNIFIVVRIIKEMLGSVASGTPCTKTKYTKNKFSPSWLYLQN